MSSPVAEAGEAVRGDRVSFWVDSTRDARDGQARLPAEADVVVVGAGIVGLTCAIRLLEAGLAPLVLDAGTVGGGVSGYTTAKLTAGHGLTYSRLATMFDTEVATLYASAQTSAIGFVRELVAERDIDCDLETSPNYVFAESQGDLELVAAETDAARRAGLEDCETAALDVPFPALAAAAIPDQSQFHPRKYLLALAALVEGGGGRVVTGRRVTEVVGRRPFRVCAGGEEVSSPLAVVATHYPIVEQGFFVPRIHPRRSYVVAAPLEQELQPGMYINVGSPTRSLRTAPLPGGGRLLLVGGEGHRVGQEPDTAERYERLERYMREHFEVGDVMYRWSTQDNHTVDGLPYVGPAGGAPGLYVATGFAGWGMSNGTMAGLAIADAVTGDDPPWASVFRLDRGARPGAAAMLREGLNVAAQQVAGPGRAGSGALTELGAGEGRVVELGGSDVAACRDRSGAVHVVSARCTHMGCMVTWNQAEESWDCPCHGSRFAPSGSVLHGPALESLKAVDVPLSVHERGTP